jgi:hypothetical protein
MSMKWMGRGFLVTLCLTFQMVSYMRHEKCEKPGLFLLLCNLFNDAESSSECIVSDDWIVVN